MKTMKKNFVLMMAATVLALPACSSSDDDKDSVPNTVLDVDATLLVGYAGDTREVVVLSNMAWEAAVDAAATEWCSVSPASGTGNVIAEVIVKNNPTLEGRNTTITFSAGTLTKTTEVTQDFVPTTLCEDCAWDGTQWVDCYVTTNAYPFDDNTTTTGVPWDGIADWSAWTDPQGATSDKDGRANTAAIEARGQSAVQICKDLGPGWYLPAYEEMINLSGNTCAWCYSPLNGRAGANLLYIDNRTEMEFIWSSTVYKGVEGRYQNTAHSPAESVAIYVSHNGNPTFGYKTNECPVYCIWR
jgi:hypothetical protein